MRASASSPDSQHWTSYWMEGRRTDRYRRMFSSSSTTRTVALPIIAPPAPRAGSATRPVGRLSASLNLRRCGADHNGPAGGTLMALSGGAGDVPGTARFSSAPGRTRRARSVRPGGVVVEQPMMDREERQLEAVGGPDLVEDVGEVVLDRVLAEHELARDLAVAEAGHDGGRDLQLAR